MQEVFQTAVIAKLCYASSTWWGFSTAEDIQRTTAFIVAADAEVIALRTLPTS